MNNLGTERSSSKEALGCLGNIVAAIIGGVVMLVVANKIPFPSIATLQSPSDPVVLSTQISQTAILASSLIDQDSTVVFQSDNGSLQHKREGKLAAISANVNVGNFVTEARFFNPYDRAQAIWDYGFLFRSTGTNQDYRLYVESDGDWFLDLTTGEDSNSNLISKNVAKGNFANLNISTDGSNLLKLIVKDSTAIFFINGEYVATLDVSEKIIAGNIYISAEFVKSHEIDNQFTRYEIFIVSSLP